MKKQPENHPKSSKKASTSSMRLALESRLLFDGAVVATAVQVVDDKAAQDHPQEALKDNIADLTPDTAIDTGDHAIFGGGLNIESAEHQLLAITSATSAGNADAPTLYVVDSRAEELHDLLANPPANTQIKVLDANRDGYQQIAEILQDRTNTSDLHILTAERGGKQWLGSSQITSNLNAINSESLAEWGNDLDADTNIT